MAWLSLKHILSLHLYLTIDKFTRFICFENVFLLMIEQKERTNFVALEFEFVTKMCEHRVSGYRYIIVFK